MSFIAEDSTMQCAYGILSGIGILVDALKSVG